VSEWQTRRLGDVLQLNYGKSLPLKNRIDGVIPVYGSNGVVGSHNYPIVDKPGLVVGRKGSAGEIHFSRGPFCPIDTTFYITEDDAPDTDLEFLFYLLRHVDLRRITGDVGVPGLNREMAYLESVRLPVAIPEQKKIAHILSTVQRAIEAQERIIQTTTELKKALMHKLFTEGLRNEPQKQTEIGLVPESWDVTTVGDVTSVKGGKRLSKGDKLVEKDTGFPYIRVTDFNDFSVDVRGLLFLTEEAQRPISRYIINRDDVFISIAGSIGITGMIPPQLDGANLTENAARLIANNPFQLHPRFLMYWLASHHCQAEIKAQTVKNAQPKLALARIKSLKVPMPTHGEQVEIARALDLAGRKAENARAKRDQLQDIFRTLLHELMTAKTRVHELAV
jgi:type I restriction enzyme S subunit